MPVDLFQKNQVLTAKTKPAPARDAQQAARDYFGLNVTSINKLDSERDQNFHLMIKDGRQYVMKIANPVEDRLVTNLQTEILLRIASVDPGLPVPHLLPTLRGEIEPLIRMKNKTDQIIRVLNYMPGIVLSQSTRSPAQRRAVGETLARLDRALQRFSHIGASHDLLWDLKSAGRTRVLLDNIKENRSQLETVLDRFDENAAVYATLRKQVIHGEFSADNILVDTTNNAVISGIIDFGDCVETQLVNELAIACAYHIDTTGGSPLAPVAEVVAAYHKVMPLQAQEINILFDLICARLAMSILINGWRAKIYPENAAYILSDNRQKWQSLQSCLNIPRDQAVSILRQACQ